ncbi:hypothetical protein, partial [Mycobacteroides abscessus]|uniref:hypothetical protein n=1 Tax=Mycobacteroides abscessus TaxID=36809 RepID=UPI000AD7FA4F
FSRDLDLYPGNDAPTTSTPSSVKSLFLDRRLAAITMRDEPEPTFEPPESLKAYIEGRAVDAGP